MLKDRYEMKKAAYTLAGALLGLGMLCGCASAPVQDVSMPSVVIQETEPVPAASSDKAAVETEAPSTVETDSRTYTDYASLQEIAKIAGMAPRNTTVEQDCVIYVDDGHNPYDIVWDYGTRYDKYVARVDEAGMWDVLFDIDFYCETYPMLAKLYHYEEGLLLEHFQTVGIHEGRQASEGFNVAAYMAHCNDEITDAFGDDYECYYFYWALNQDTQSSVDVSGEGYPVQLGAEMTAMQSRELQKVNEYRVEAGAEPVEFDPEIAAFANYRAWVDFVGMSTAHDWADAHTDELDEFLDFVGANWVFENKCTNYSNYNTVPIDNWYLRYYKSKEHYEAMIDPGCAYFGCSNMYVGEWKYDPYAGIEFDIYTDSADTPLH